jgi:hypothetical protein
MSCITISYDSNNKNFGKRRGDIGVENCKQNTIKAIEKTKEKRAQLKGLWGLHQSGPTIALMVLEAVMQPAGSYQRGSGPVEW